jgi:hypothetical protein
MTQPISSHIVLGQPHVLGNEGTLAVSWDMSRTFPSKNLNNTIHTDPLQIQTGQIRMGSSKKLVVHKNIFNLQLMQRRERCQEKNNGFMEVIVMV